MLEQIRTLFWLKYRLFANSKRIGKKISLAFSICLLLLGVLLSLGISVGLFFLSRIFDEKVEIWVLMAVFDGLMMLALLVWMVSVVSDIQRSDIIDFRKMMFLPVSLKTVFGLNFLWSIYGFPAVFLLPMVVFLVGLSAQLGARMLLGLLLVLGFYAMVAAWVYYLRGWLAILMENKKRRRLILVVLPFSVILLLQLPNLLRLILGSSQKHALKEFVKVHGYDVLMLGNGVFPPCWLPYGVYSLARGESVTAGLCFSGMLLIAWLGLSIGYRSTKRYYTGTLRKRPKLVDSVSPPENPVRAKGLPDVRIPFLPDDIGALAVADFLTYMRHPRVRLSVVMSFIMPIVILGVLVMRVSDSSTRFPGELVLTGLFIFPMLQYLMFLCSPFGASPGELRRLILLPASRYKYLFAKNLALFPFVFVTYLLLILVAGSLLDIRVRSVFIAGIQVFDYYLLCCLLGNFFSLYCPYRINMESMGKSKGGSFSFFMGLLLLLLTPLLFLPSVVCLAADFVLRHFYGYNGISIGLLLSLLSLPLMIVLYWKILLYAGTLLSQRETTVLEILTKDDP